MSTLVDRDTIIAKYQLDETERRELKKEAIENWAVFAKPLESGKLISIADAFAQMLDRSTIIILDLEYVFNKPPLVDHTRKAYKMPIDMGSSCEVFGPEDREYLWCLLSAALVCWHDFFLIVEEGELILEFSHDELIFGLNGAPHRVKEALEIFKGHELKRPTKKYLRELYPWLYERKKG